MSKLHESIITDLTTKLSEMTARADTADKKSEAFEAMYRKVCNERNDLTAKLAAMMQERDAAQKRYETQCEGTKTRMEQLQARDARIVELEAGLHAVDNDRHNIQLAHDVAIQQLARAWEALAFYADPQTYGMFGGSVDRVIQDAGKTAKQALREMGEAGL